ncbi:hypothetical protein DDV96_15620 [Marixanthomonas spongiae]|uniref:Uncharacterized protein n=1 Tax=Marixanthomonas spongiae TaxID=2174845 RepID=A0A2U0HSA5_9FLAO|nr:hypothetical protein DDV96_15620 [Marixanthomonas spongiae]
MSVFTDDVEKDVFKCKYGAFYDTRNKKDLKLQYTAIVGGFISVSILKKGKFVDTICMLKAWFEIE